MTDMNILMAGAVVFGLMVVGAILTVLEFKQISKDNKPEVIEYCLNMAVATGIALKPNRPDSGLRIPGA